MCITASHTNQIKSPIIACALTIAANRRKMVVYVGHAHAKMVSHTGGNIHKMSRKYTTRHTRSISTYHRRSKASYSDRYGQFDNGRQKTPDRIAGATLYYSDRKVKQ
jgi:hypothetical protein